MFRILRKNKNIVIIGVILILTGVVILIHQFQNKIELARAASGDNVFGWAWNDNVGWISFNSLNCDVNNNGFIDTDCGGNDDASTPVVDYGVKVDADGNFSGYAWNETEGYIRFDAPPDDSSGQYPADPQHSVQLDVTTRQVSGWARICARADDTVNCKNGTEGWIKLQGTGYGVTLDKANVFHGYAWSEDIGWISFNCAEGGVGGVDICATSDYKVAAQTNVSGWAWNEKYGWFSFNCKDESVCGSHFYGVNIEPITYNLGGYAWNNNLGWLSFEEVAAPDYSFNSHCESTCNNTNNCTACYSINDRKIYGWAKILALGDDGWVRLDDDNTADGFDYGLSLDGTGFAGDFHGYAWNGNDNGNGIGWLSFNCAEGGAGGADICNPPTLDYKVSYSEFFNVNHKPQVQNLSAPNWPYTSACSTEARQAILRWQFNDQDAGDSQKAYRIIVSLDNDPSAPNVIDTGQVLSNVNQHIVTSANLGYDQSYYWWVEVWDQAGESSGLVQYDSASDTDNDDGNNLTFTTYKHEFPDPETSEGFIWFPENPSAGEEVRFISTTSAKYYTGGFGTKANCDDAHCHWRWTFGDSTSGSFKSSRYASTTIGVFDDAGNMEMKLNVTDNDTYSCTSTKSLDIKKKLPTWIEKR